MKLKTTVLYLLALLIFTPPMLAGTDSEEYQILANKLQQALEHRDYKEAKLSLTALLPLMKEDIKEFKREVSEAKKADVKADEIKKMKDTLKRKNEIFESLEHLLNVSPAAIRVRAKQVITIVGEFEELSTSYVASL